MSFGWSVSDIALLTRLAYKTTQGARAACGEHDELTREVSSLHIILQRLDNEASKSGSFLDRPRETYKQELETIASGCEHVLGQLDKILVKYNALSNQERSARRLWKQVRYSSGAVADVADLRSKIGSYSASLSLFLNIVSIGTVGAVERKIDRTGGDLKDIKITVNGITARLTANSCREGSVLTSYPDDDKNAWRELRRELVRDGFRDDIMRKHMKTIKAYVKELGSRGILDDSHDSTSPHSSRFLGDEVSSIENEESSCLLHHGCSIQNRFSSLGQDRKEANEEKSPSAAPSLVYSETSDRKDPASNEKSQLPFSPTDYLATRYTGIEAKVHNDSIHHTILALPWEITDVLSLRTRDRRKMRGDGTFQKISGILRGIAPFHFRPSPGCSDDIEASNDSEIHPGSLLSIDIRKKVVLVWTLGNSGIYIGDLENTYNGSRDDTECLLENDGEEAVSLPKMQSLTIENLCEHTRLSARPYSTLKLSIGAEDIDMGQRHSDWNGLNFLTCFMGFAVDLLALCPWGCQSLATADQSTNLSSASVQSEKDSRQESIKRTSPAEQAIMGSSELSLRLEEKCTLQELTVSCRFLLVEMSQFVPLQLTPIDAFQVWQNVRRDQVLLLCKLFRVNMPRLRISLRRIDLEALRTFEFINEDLNLEDRVTSARLVRDIKEWVRTYIERCFPIVNRLGLEHGYVDRKIIPCIKPSISDWIRDVESDGDAYPPNNPMLEEKPE